MVDKIAEGVDPTIANAVAATQADALAMVEEKGKTFTEKLGERSYAVAGAKLASPVQRRKRRGELNTKWKDEYGYEYSPGAEQDYLRNGYIPESVTSGEEMRMAEIDEQIAQQGGMLKIMAKHIIENPGEVVKELGYGLLADPWLLLGPQAFTGVYSKVTLR